MDRSSVETGRWVFRQRTKVCVVGRGSRVAGRSPTKSDSPAATIRGRSEHPSGQLTGGENEASRCSAGLAGDVGEGRREGARAAGSGQSEALEGGMALDVGPRSTPRATQGRGHPPKKVAAGAVEAGGREREAAGAGAALGRRGLRMPRSWGEGVGVEVEVEVERRASSGEGEGVRVSISRQ